MARIRREADSSHSHLALHPGNPDLEYSERFIFNYWFRQRHEIVLPVKVVHKSGEQIHVYQLHIIRFY